MIKKIFRLSSFRNKNETDKSTVSNKNQQLEHKCKNKCKKEELKKKNKRFQRLPHLSLTLYI